MSNIFTVRYDSVFESFNFYFDSRKLHDITFCLDCIEGIEFQYRSNVAQLDKDLICIGQEIGLKPSQNLFVLFLSFEDLSSFCGIKINSQDKEEILCYLSLFYNLFTQNEFIKSKQLTL
jgi:hypothetical protein